MFFSLFLYRFSILLAFFFKAWYNKATKLDFATGRKGNNNERSFKKFDNALRFLRIDHEQRLL